MSDDRLFFKTLEEKYSEILKIAVRKKYIFFIPSSKYLIPSMLNKHFFENHTFYQCDYHPTLFISLHGRVLEHSQTLFKSYIGFKKDMSFNIVEELYREVSISGVSSNPTIKVIYIDNVVDETCYNESLPQSTGQKKEILNRYNSKEEYLAFFKTYCKEKPTEGGYIESQLREISDKMINNYIFIKNHVETYAMHFQQEFSAIKSVSTDFQFKNLLVLDSTRKIREI